MNDVKLRLSLCIPGAQKLSKQECLKNPKESYNTSIVNVNYEVKSGKTIKVKSQDLIIKTRKQRLIKQIINITSEAYYYMIDSTKPPFSKYAKIVSKRKSGTPISLWSTMRQEERLKVHLDLIAEHFNASKYTYEVLDD